ncbi:MAG: Mur ligase family protein [Patescibacteria group bacterium]|jgi:UDP-N-acetylmuramoylalanine--D-glutamate ligase
MILIFGLGSYPGGSGSSAALYLAKKNIPLVITDLKLAKQLHQPTLKKLQKFPNVKFVFGKHRKQDIVQAEYIVRNPGVPDNEYIKYAKQLGKPIVNDVGLFLQAIRQRFTNKEVVIVGVTGTRGKSTTTALITEILRAKFGKPKVHCGGNIGNSPLNFLSKIKAGHIVVLELSSWLLRDINNLQCAVAVVTNLLPDHLNYYRSMSSYQRDKERIFIGQNKYNFAVLNPVDTAVKSMASRTVATKIWFKPKLINGAKIIGAHNQLNIGAAWAVGQIFGITPASMRQAIKQFNGVPNRLEKIWVYKKVTFYNDTTATTPDATIAALNAFKKPVILIAGGNSKQLSLKHLVKIIPQHVKQLILLPGNVTKDFPAGVLVKTMKEAVQVAWQYAKPDDIILLSPGVTWLPFMNEFARGRQFVKYVKKLL